MYPGARPTLSLAPLSTPFQLLVPGAKWKLVVRIPKTAARVKCEKLGVWLHPVATKGDRQQVPHEPELEKGRNNEEPASHCVVWPTISVYMAVVSHKLSHPP